MNEEQVNLQAIQQHIASHPERVQIECYAIELRASLAARGETFQLALALVGAELAAYIHTIYPTAREIVVRNGNLVELTYGDPEFDKRHPWPPPGFTEEENDMTKEKQSQDTSPLDELVTRIANLEKSFGQRSDLEGLLRRAEKRLDALTDAVASLNQRRAEVDTALETFDSKLAATKSRMSTDDRIDHLVAIVKRMGLTPTERALHPSLK